MRAQECWVEQLLLCIERSQLRGFAYLIRMPFLGGFLAFHTGRRPGNRPRTYWRTIYPTTQRQMNRKQWLIDRLDLTKNYLKKITSGILNHCSSLYLGKTPVFAASYQTRDDLSNTTLLALMWVRHQPFHVRLQHRQKGIAKISEQSLEEQEEEN